MTIRRNPPMNFQAGDRVRFHGTKHPDTPGRFVSAESFGKDTFEATVTELPYGICYALRWDDGEPCGLPFHDFALELVERRGHAEAERLRALGRKNHGN